ncbi:MAG: elongation factor P maturation arginine rhamnosyltransferase EarP [Pseudomonadota bacterium]
MTWDIFCTVIDNFGDIGVTWRLARQLADEHRVSVRLWVDDLAAFHQIRPEVDPTRAIQTLAGVEIRHWTDPLPAFSPGEVVIEALACNLPESFIQAMAVQSPPPVWLNLEYLTAETWADGVHGLPSPHPRLPLVKYFYVPGFSPQTGGLTRENWLSPTRNPFQASQADQDDFWRNQKLPPRQDKELRISLFSYENAALPGWLETLAASPIPVRLLAPEGKALPQIARALAVPELGPGTSARQGALKVHVLPMLDQDTYDRLLWACDLNFVRGEDSFLRAQYAARPMVWQAYRQAEGAHFAKLEAFLDRYCATLDPDTADTTRTLWQAWNAEADMTAAWPRYLAHQPALQAHAKAWDRQLAAVPDIASKLMIFCEKIMKTR